MKKLFNVLTSITSKVPIFFNFDNPFFYPAWTGYYDYLEDNLHWRWVSNPDNLYDNDKFIDEATYATFKPNNFFNYVGTWPIIIHEHGSTHHSDVGYYYYYLSKNGIPLPNFVNVYNRDGNWWNLLNFMIGLLKKGNEEVEMEYDKYTRNPVRGRRTPTLQTGDFSYKPEFNMGYDWKYGEVNIEYIGTKNQIEITGKREEMFNKYDSGIIRYNGNFYPSKFDIPEKEAQTGFLFKIDILLNGKYWTNHTYSVGNEAYCDWFENSYGYGYASTVVNIYKDTSGTWHMNIPPFTVIKNNVGTDYQQTYSVFDIPQGYRIREFEEEEENS